MQPVSKSEFATMRGVSRSAVSQMIADRKLTPPALLADGKIDPALADQQLRAPRPVRIRTTSRNRALVDAAIDARIGAAQKRADEAADQMRRAALAAAIRDIEARLFPGVIRVLALSPQQTEVLAREWFDCRRDLCREGQ